MTHDDVSSPSADDGFLTEAGRHWAEQLHGWGVPEHILAQAEVPPWAHDPATFAMDDTVDPASPIFEMARELLPIDGGSVMDVGCGGGRSSVPLAPRATHITGVDENPAMLAKFATACDEIGVAHAEIQGKWPDAAIEAEVHGAPLAPRDVVVCHHVVYNVQNIEAFVVALTAAATLGVVVVLPKRHPQSAWNEGWLHFWNLKRPDGPTSDDFVAVVRALGIEPEVVEVPRPPMSRHAAQPSQLAQSARRRLCLPEARLPEIEAWIRDHPPAFMSEVVMVRWPGGLS